MIQRFTRFIPPIIPPGYKIADVSSQVIYLSVAVHTINQIQLPIFDQDGNLVSFRGEPVTFRLHIKSL